jgi:predicted secreted protein
MSMAKDRKRLPLSKIRTTKRKVAASAVTSDHINMLLRIAELYNTSYDFEAAEWFWGQQYKETTSYEEFRNKHPQGSKELNYSKGSHQNLS